MHDTTVAVYEENVSFNDNHHQKTRINPHPWCQEQHSALRYARLCQAAACLQGAWTSCPFYTQDA